MSVLETSAATELAAELRERLRGEVRFDGASRALYATDGSNYRQVPIGVVVPHDVDDVVEAVAACRRHGAPVLPRGGGTSLAGQCCNVAVVLDFSKYLNRIVELDPDAGRAQVQPGLILDHLRDAAEAHHLTFGPDPSTHSRCTLGGMIGNNSCGVHSVMAGRTADNVFELDVLTYDGLRLSVGPTSEDELERIVAEGGRRGEIYAGLRSLRDRYAGLIRARYPKLPRRVSGYNLDELLPENGFHVARALVGTEGTCVTVLEATVRLVHSPPHRSLLVLGYPDVFRAGDAVPEVLGYGPVGLEGLDDQLVQDMRAKGLNPASIAMLPPGHGWLLAEFGGDTAEEADGRARELADAVGHGDDPPHVALFECPADQSGLWLVRESGLGATASVPGRGDTWEGWEDSAVPPEVLGDYLRDFRKLLEHYDHQTAALYGHFGDACVHTRIDFDLRSHSGVEKYRAFVEEAADLVVSYGGSLSGEHGDGQSKAELLPKMFGEELVRAFGEFKGVWDPENKMNPGKVVEPYRVDENLRLGTRYNPTKVKTHFSFTEDEGDFAKAALRCVGVGACRRTEGGTMCPSFMVTREEEHSTRGRARLLFEMLQGDVLAGGWRNEAVKDALDLCLACKGCKGDCPVNVDMATYKAEFLSHHYRGRLRPVTAYTIGLIRWGARLGSRAPGLANFLTGAPFLGHLAKAAAGVHPKRSVPAFAPETFSAWFRRRAAPPTGGPRVVLWPDTFNDHFHPQVLRAGVEVLEAAGFSVELPPRPLCCGRPLYDYGMLTLAKRQLRQILDALRPAVAEGIPVVGLEPSCVAVFRDELVNLLPHDEDARRLSLQTMMLSEFLERKAPHWDVPRVEAKAVVQGHCHHEAVMTLDAEEALLRRMGVDFEVLEGCCGMAGSFGFEKDHYDVSMKVGERVLLPAVRAADGATLVLADGFSCREQIAQGAGREALNVAEVLQRALADRRAHQPSDGRTP